MKSKHRTSACACDKEKRLETMINQHKMLMNTLHEILDMDGGASLQLVKSEADRTLKEIEELRKQIAEEKLTCNESYGENEVVGCDCSLYDKFDKVSIGQCNKVSIDSHQSAGPNDGSYFGSASEDDVRFNHHDVMDSWPIKDAMLCDRFTVDLSDLHIPEYMVKSVCAFSKNALDIEVYDFMCSTNTGRIPVIQSIKDSKEFRMTISNFDKSGKLLYREIYIGCRVADVFREKLRYSESTPRTITFNVTYDSVRYETAY